SATLSPALAGKLVTFSVGGTAVGTGTTDATGVATYNYQIRVSTGNHTILASFAGDTDISAASDTAQLTVARATGDLTVNSPSTPVGQTVTLTANLTPGVANKLITFTVDGTVVGTDLTDASGVATFDYTPLKPVGNYPILVTWAVDGDIAGDTGNGTLTVTQGTGSMTVANRSGAYRSSVTLQATLSPALANKTVTFTVNGAAAGSGLTNASGVATSAPYLINLVPGTYNIVATWAGDADISAASGTGQLTVVAATGTVTVTNTTGALGTTATLTANLSPAVIGKTITFTVNGAPAGSGVTNASGVATSSYPITLPVGSYPIVATWAGDADVTGNSGTGQLNVTQGTGSMLAADQIATYRQTVTLSATLTPALAGKTVTFTVDGAPAGSGITNASGVAVTNYLVNDSVGTHTILASFAGDVDLTAASDTAQLTVNIATGTLTVPNQTGRVGDTVALTATLGPAVAGRLITFSIDGTDIGTDLTDAAGLATVDYTIAVPSGNHTIGARFAGDATITAISSSGQLTVTAAPGTMLLEDLTIRYNGTGQLRAHLSPALAGKTVAFLVNGVFIGNGTTDATGLATFPGSATITAGTYTISAQFAGDADIGAASDTATLTITKANTTLTTGNVTLAYNQAGSLTATLLDEGNAPISGATVTFRVNGGAALTASTDASGVATRAYTPTLAPGTYPITVDFAGTVNYNAATQATATLTVTKANTTITASDVTIAYNQAGSLTATLRDQFGAVISGATLTFKVNNGANLTATTDASGVATLPYTPTLAPGTYPITVDFAGTVNYNAAPQATANLTVSKANTTITTANVTIAYNQAGNLTATLRDQGGAVISGAILTFKVNGGAGQTATTNASGVATLPYTPTLAPGTYPFTVDYAGSALYNAAPQASANLTVPKANTTLTTANQTVTYGQPVTLTATLTDAGGTAISGATITFRVNGAVVGSNTTGATGVANFTYTPALAAGTYPIDADFAGNANYNSSSAVSRTLTVNKAATTLTTADQTIQYGASVTLTATLMSGATPVNGRTVTFRVNGTVVGSGTTAGAGVATYTYVPALPPGSYTINADFATDAYYLAASATPRTLTVTKANTDLAPASGLTVQYGQVLNLTSALTRTDNGAAISAKPVTFAVDGTTLSPTYNTNIGGVASYPWTANLPAGTYTYGVSWPGDANYNGASGSSTLTVTRGTQTLFLTTSLASIQYSDATALTATLSPARAGQTVTFRIGGTTLGTAVTNASGVAVLNWPADQPAGTYTIIADVAADSYYVAASGSVSQTVTKESATLVYTGARANPTAPYQLLAKVIPQADGTTGDLTRAGSVQFSVTSATWTVARVFTAAVDANGDASYSINPPWENLTVSYTLLTNNYYTAPATTPVTITAAGQGIGLWGEYFDDPSDPNNPDTDPGLANRKYFDSYVFGRLDSTVNFNWGNNAPDTTLYGSTKLWSVRWTGYVQVPTTRNDWQLCVLHDDDGARLTLNGNLLVNQWSDLNNQRTDCTGNQTLTAGVKVPIKLEFYNATGGAARVTLQWRQGTGAVSTIPSTALYPPDPLPLTTDVGLVGAYYDNMNLTGLVGTRVDDRINFEWQQDPPGAGITNGDTFSVRWTGKYTPSVSHTHLWTWSDDGVRVSINGTQIINAWTDHSVRWDSGTIPGGFIAGQTYDIQLDFYENGVHAVIELHRGNAAGAQALVTTSELTHSPGIPVPTGLAATPQAGPSIRLNWTANSGTATIMARSYNIYRSTTPGFTPDSTTLVGSALGRATTTWTDTAVVTGITYYYKITALDTAANESGPSTEVFATAP
ncbi:MAG TPA: Ig-like domain repeat protein, partial [Symbiobacteriaceae bacterium]|nr:Ig-like domain repeat protein [Symbiobacteriaceae bacterium]